MCRRVLFGGGPVLVFLDGKCGSGKGKVPDTGFFEWFVFWAVSLGPFGVSGAKITALLLSDCRNIKTYVFLRFFVWIKFEIGPGISELDI